MCDTGRWGDRGARFRRHCRLVLLRAASGYDCISAVVRAKGVGVTKADIIERVYEKVGGFSKKEASEVVEAVFDAMKDVLADGDKVKISGFGNFVVRAKKQRIGRNPQTGQPIPITARRVLTFKPSQVLKNVLNPEKARARVEVSGDVSVGGGQS